MQMKLKMEIRFSKSFAAGAVAFECIATRVTYVNGLLLLIKIFTKVTFPYIPFEFAANR